jgi:PAS domain S-box-containing protein
MCEGMQEQKPENIEQPNLSYPRTGIAIFLYPFLLLVITLFTLYSVIEAHAISERAATLIFSIVGLFGVANLAIEIAFIRPFLKMRDHAGGLIQAAKQAGERWELALKGSGAGYWDYNVEDGTFFFSAEFMRMFGYAARDYSGNIEQWYELFHPDDVEGGRRSMASHLDKRTPNYSIEHRIRKANGEYVWVEDRGQAVWGASGKAIRVAGVTRDITNIKRVQEVLESRTNELEEAQAKIEEEMQNVKKFQKAVDASTEAVMITDPLGAIIYVNAGWTKLNGYTDTEALGRNPRMLKSDKTKPEIFSALWEKISSGLPFTTEDIFNRRKNGTEYQAELSVFPVREGTQTLFYVAICHDITQRKEVDRAKTEFVSLASHQLRTPLSAIRWYSEMLMSKYVGQLNEKQMQYLKEIYQGNLRMIELVNALLNVSRIDLGTFAIEPEPMSLTETCESVLAELLPQITLKGQTVTKIFDTAPSTYYGDPKLMRIIFQNFLSNSVKYTQAGGSIEVEIATREADLYIRVSDNGYGIPKEQHNKIFEKLFRADNVRQKDTEGTGLGMYIVKAIVDSSGGRIWFDSEENKGTTFHVLLPIAGMPKKTGSKGLE